MPDMLIEVLISTYALISTAVNAYFAYKQSEEEAEAQQAASELKAEAKRNEQSQDMLKFWVGEFNELKEEWRERETKLKEEKAALEEEVNALERELEEKEKELEERRS